MSIAAIITAGETRDYVPIATLETFRRVWLPLIESLDLQWLRLFESGADFGHDDLPFVRAELLRLREALLAAPDPSGIAEEVAHRIGHVLARIDAVMPLPDVVFSVG